MCSKLAVAMDFAGRRAGLLSGAAINVTEGRAAEHTAQQWLPWREAATLAFSPTNREAILALSSAPWRLPTA